MNRVGNVLSAILAMYLFFMILDRGLSVIYGFNFQPYGPYAPPGFAIWGHIANGSLALLGVWVLLKLWNWGGRSRHPVILRIIIVALYAFLVLWIPYHNDADHLIKNGRGDTLPYYVLANAAYVAGAGLLTLRLSSVRGRLILIGVLIPLFLILHYRFYVPMFPDFRWV